MAMRLAISQGCFTCKYMLLVVFEEKTSKASDAAPQIKRIT